jgi:hypothetical protein
MMVSSRVIDANETRRENRMRSSRADFQIAKVGDRFVACSINRRVARAVPRNALRGRRNGVYGFGLTSEAAKIVSTLAYIMDDPRQKIAELEGEIEKLAEAAERCRKLDLAARAAILAGGVCLAAILLGAIRSDALPVFGSLTAIIGGIVVYGSNSSTARQIAERLKAADAQRAALIGAIDLHLVSEPQ